MGELEESTRDMPVRAPSLRGIQKECTSSSFVSYDATVGDIARGSRVQRPVTTCATTSHRMRIACVWAGSESPPALVPGVAGRSMRQPTCAAVHKVQARTDTDRGSWIMNVPSMYMQT